MRIFFVRTLLVACAGGALLAACGSFSGSDSSAEEDASDGAINRPDASDDAVADAFSVEAATDADPPVNLLQNGDFELGCAGWFGGAAGATLSPSAVARSGGKSCLVCGKDAGVFDIAQEMKSLTLVPGRQYAGEAYVRADDVLPAAPAIEGAFIVYDEVTRAQHRSPTPAGPLTKSWQQVSALATVNKDAGTLEFSVTSVAANGQGCFLVDDARVFLLP